MFYSRFYTFKHFQVRSSSWAVFGDGRVKKAVSPTVFGAWINFSKNYEEKKKNNTKSGKLKCIKWMCDPELSINSKERREEEKEREKKKTHT